MCYYLTAYWTNFLVKVGGATSDFSDFNAFFGSNSHNQFKHLMICTFGLSSKKYLFSFMFLYIFAINFICSAILIYIVAKNICTFSDSSLSLAKLQTTHYIYYNLETFSAYTMLLVATVTNCACAYAMTNIWEHAKWSYVK